MICLDVANGYSESFVKTVEKVIDSSPLALMAVSSPSFIKLLLSNPGRVHMRVGANETSVAHHHCWRSATPVVCTCV
eukprot:scaffold57302_cov36-Tisochrysis_lutea.AAC.7